MGVVTRAAVLRSRDEPFALEEVELPDLREGEVLVEVAAVGMCHTDLIAREGLLGDAPLVAGHEGAGVVAALGPGVTGVSVGDRVVLSFDHCRRCANCQLGHPAYCDEFFLRNFAPAFAPAGVAVPGGEAVATRWFGQSSFAGLAVSGLNNIVPIGDDVPFEIAAPFGCGFLTGAAAVRNVLDVRPGQSVAVLGVGSVGMAGVLAAAAGDAGRIIAVDLAAPRLELARGLGATHAVGAEAGNELKDALLATGGPVDAVLDTTGHPRVIEAAVDALAPRGRCAIVGLQHEALSLGPFALLGGKVVTGVYMGDSVPQVDIPLLLGLWRRGRFPVDRLVSTYDLAAIADAENDMLAAKVVKPVLLTR